MKGKKAAAIALLLVWLALSFPLPTTSQSGIVVTGADSVQDTSTVHSPGLASSTQSVAPRVAVEYAHSTAPQALAEPPTTLQSFLNSVAERVVAEYASSTAPRSLTEPPTTLRDLINSITERVVAEYASSTAPRPLTEPPVTLWDLINSITERVVAEYASSTRAEEVAYPVGLLDDSTPPQISHIAANAVGSDGATITWATDEFATSTVLYGTLSGAYSATVSDPLYVKQHEVALSELVPGTTYYYVVRSTDRSDNTATSAEQSFLMEPTSPVLSVSPTSLDFEAAQTQKTFNISNAGVGTLTWSVSEDKTWLSVSPTSGTEDATITVNVDRSGLSTGDYTAGIIVSSNGGNETVHVAMEVGGTYSISGRVTDSSGNPSSGVTISDGAGHTATTDSNGNYTIGDLSAGSYTLTPSKSDYTFSPASRTVSVPPSATGQDFTGTPTPPPPLDKPPVVLVHGFNGSCADWSYNDSFKHLEEWLRNDGYDVHCAHPFASSDFAPPLPVNARKLAADIAEIKSRTGADRVIIIAHSLGGIIARAYIESSLYQDDVVWLYVLGSPNGGSWLASQGMVFICFDVYRHGALCEITIEGMETFNSLHWPRRPQGLPYRFIAGTGQNRTWWGKVLGWLIPGPDDATISVASVHALDGDALVKYTSPETHSSGVGEPSYFDPDSGSQSYRECIGPELSGTGACLQRVLSASEMAAEAEPILNSPIASFTGVITTGYAISHTVSVDTSVAGSFNLFWMTGTLSFSLTTPTGTVIDPVYAQTNADVEYGQAPITDSITAAATYYIANTIPGTWTLTVSGVDTGAEGVLYGANVVVESDILLSTDSARDLYTIGDTVVATASLTAGGSGVSGATVQAAIHRPDGIAEIIPLYDDGAHNDGAVGDGLYGGSYTVAVSGYHIFRASAEGTVDDEPFNREAQGILIVASEAASLSGSYTDYPVDEDGDGRYEWLALDVGIDTNRAGDYTLSAQLVGDDSSFVSHVLTYTTFTTGTQTVTVYFDGEDILKSSVDGPYTVTEVYLMDDSGASIPTDIEMNVWTTAAYDHRQFGTLEKIYLPLVLKS